MTAPYRCEHCGTLSASRVCWACRMAERNLIPVQDADGNVHMIDLERLRDRVAVLDEFEVIA